MSGSWPAPPVKRDLLDILVCPEDKAPLDLAVVEEADDAIVTGTLTCTECGFAYPIEQGIPNLLPPAMHEDGVMDADPAEG